MSKKKHSGPKILFLDIETAPILALVWGLFDQNIALNQIVRDTFILSWAAKWYEDEHGVVYGPHKKVMYMDQRRNNKPVKDDPKLLKGIWELLDEADIVVGQNSKRFDVKRLNTAFIKAGLKPPGGYKQIDTLEIAKKNFAFTSNKLEFTTENLCTKYKKLKHKKFPGFSLWTACLAGNMKAWKEMQTYNVHDILSTEEYYNKIQGWHASGPNFNVYHNDYHHRCQCGSLNLKRNGYTYTATGKFARYKCKECGRESRDSKNMLDKEKRSSLKRNT